MGRLGDGRLGDGEIGRRGDGETGRRGDWETGRMGELHPVSASPNLPVFYLVSSRETWWPYQPSIVLIAVTARFSYAAIVAMFFFSTSVSEASVKFGSALYQSKLEKYFCNQVSLNTFPRRA